MRTHTTITKLSAFLAAALLATACSEAVGPADSAHKPFQWTPAFATVANGSSGIALDQQNGTLGETGTLIIKGFNPTNPHRGDAIVATFFWVGSANIIDSVADVLTTAPTYTPVGNRYTLVEYVTAGGVSMATYVATNVQGFPYPAPSDAYILAVRANLSQPVSDGGVMISAWSGVYPILAGALGAHRSATGTGSAYPTVADPGPVAVAAGALAFAITSANSVVGREPPPGFGVFAQQSDAFLVDEADT